MATLRKQWDLADNRIFSNRIVTAVATVAFEVVQEPEATVGGPLRRSLALAVLAAPDQSERRFAIACLTDPATFDAQVDNGGMPVATAAADTALLTRVRTVWSVMAGHTV